MDRGRIKNKIGAEKRADPSRSSIGMALTIACLYINILLIPPTWSQPALDADQSLVGSRSPTVKLKILEEYETKVREALHFSPPVLCNLTLGPIEKDVLKAALANADFLKFTQENGGVDRNEIFAVHALPAADLSTYSPACVDQRCYRVEMYNFTRNITSIAIVEESHKSVLTVQHQFDTQPEVPEHLGRIAVELAVNAPQIQKALGRTPVPREFIMQSTKSALNATRCERSQHLCVAPTFVEGDRALWSIVDLTAGRLAGLRWTHWQDDPLTEGQLVDAVIDEELCQKNKTVERNGWRFSYGLSGSDGLVVRDLTYQKRPALHSVKNVDWHVSYSGTDGFGYSDAIGCPLFSTAAVIPAALPKVEELSRGRTRGFELVQTFRSKHWPLPCNYSYQQRFQFWNDGSFRIVVANLGRGCGENGIYRPVIRINLPFEDAVFEEWDGDSWEAWDKEDWRLQSAGTPYTREGYAFRVRNSLGDGYYIEPARGQFLDSGRGDNAYIYLTRNEAERDEGESDMPTIGPCCNDNEQQGPQQFLNAEAVRGTDLVLWYVPQLKNEGTPGREYCWASAMVKDGKVEVREFPCYAGPRFVPINLGKESHG